MTVGKRENRGAGVGVVVLFAVIGFMVYQWHEPYRTAGITKVTSEYIFMDDGTVWTHLYHDEWVGTQMPVAVGDRVRYLHLDMPGDRSGLACELHDNTTGWTFDATRITAPFDHTSCPAQ